MSIYDDLIRFKLGLLERVQRDLPKLHPVAQKAADVDVVYIEAQMAGYYESPRPLVSAGVASSTDSGSIPTVGFCVTRERRRCSLIESSSSSSSSLDHPHRYYTSSQIMGYAWSDSALFPEEVRNYVSRVRKILTRLEIPC